MDVPLVLDAIPRKRGQSKHEIVEKLLSQATEMVDIDLVNQPIGTVGEDDWMAKMMLNMMAFVDAKTELQTR